MREGGDKGSEGGRRWRRGQERKGRRRLGGRGEEGGKKGEGEKKGRERKGMGWDEERKRKRWEVKKRVIQNGEREGKKKEKGQSRGRGRGGQRRALYLQSPAISSTCPWQVFCKSGSFGFMSGPFPNALLSPPSSDRGTHFVRHRAWCPLCPDKAMGCINLGAGERKAARPAPHSAGSNELCTSWSLF